MAVRCNDLAQCKVSKVRPSVRFPPDEVFPGLGDRQDQHEDDDQDIQGQRQAANRRHQRRCASPSIVRQRWVPGHLSRLDPDVVQNLCGC